MNPDTGKFEPLAREEKRWSQPKTKRRRRRADQVNQPVMLRPDGTEVPASWDVFETGEVVEVKGTRFRIAYIGSDTILLESVKPEDR